MAMRFEMGLLQPRLATRQPGNSHFPCPNGNATWIGDVQRFDVFCGKDVGGVEIYRAHLDSLNTCVNMCTSHQAPRCDGVTFRMDNVCILKNGVSPTSMQTVAWADSAIGILPNPPPTSGCSSLGTGKIELVQAKNFNLQCGQIFAGNDVEQQFQPTFDACLSACASLGTCGGISFDISQEFKNCYLKTNVSTTSGMLAKAGVDSAIVAVDNGAPAPPPLLSSAPPPLAAPAVGTVGPAAVSGSVLIMVATAVAGGAAAAQEATPTPTAVASTPTAAAPVLAESLPSSPNAWIAAPVIGGLAAFTVMFAILILRGRRRVRGAGGVGEKYHMADEESGGGGSRTSSPSSSAPASRRGNGGAGIKMLSGSGRRVGHEMLTAGTGPGLEGLVVGDAVSKSGGDGGGAGGTWASHTRHGSGDSSRKGRLRDSQNGLRLNRVSIHGTGTELALRIPQTCAGPEIDRAP